MALPTSTSVEFSLEEEHELTASELSEPPFPVLPMSMPLPTNTEVQADAGYQATEISESTTESLEADKYQALAICCVTRDYDATDSIGSVAAGTVVYAVEKRGNRIKIQIPAGDSGVDVTGSHRQGWIDMECSTGERVVKPIIPMQTLSPDEDCPGGGIAYPQPGMAFHGPRPGPPGLAVPPVLVQAGPYMPMAPPYGAPRPLVPSLPFKPLNLQQRAPMRVEGSPQPPETTSDNAAAIPLPEEFPALRPSMRRRSFPIPTPAPMQMNTDPFPAPAPGPMPSTVKRTSRRGATKRGHDSGTGKRHGYRNGIDFPDPHQALVSNTPGVVLYPRDPRTGAVIIPKHLRRRNRSRRRKAHMRAAAAN